MQLTLSELSKPGYLQRIYSTSNSKAAIQNPIIYYLRIISALMLSKISWSGEQGTFPTQATLSFKV